MSRRMDTAHRASGQRASDRVETFGCRLNSFESEVIRDHLGATGPGARIVFNTCAVTAEAERQARQAIRRARRSHPDAEIVVTGCAAQIHPDRYAGMPEVDRVVGNREKLLSATWSGTEALAVGDVMRASPAVPPLVAGFEGRVRGYLQVQQGCDHRCTFCTIPFGRGNNRSLPVEALIRQARTLVENGYRELALTGVDIASYGRDGSGQPLLGDMLRRLFAEVPDLPRLRLSSLDPAAIDRALLDLVAGEERLMPHLHLSIQSGHDLILKRMKRRHLRRDVLQLAGRLRDLRPGITLGADLIAGFPTETDDMFRASLDLVPEAGLTHLHVFPFSARANVPAARMPQVAQSTRRERARQLRRAGAAALRSHLDGRLGARERLLVERDGTGRTEHYLTVTVSGEHEPGAMVDAVVTGRDGERLRAVPAP